jgi:hypothetical protein
MTCVVGALAAAALAESGRMLRRLRLARHGAVADDRVCSEERSGRQRARGALARACDCLEARLCVVRCPWTPFLSLSPGQRGGCAGESAGSYRVLPCGRAIARRGGRLTGRVRRRKASCGMVPIHCWW